jgi:predicted Fe-Mo cluster-binding NifX family protein/DNA-binding HxlR family transcriptional regulator
MGRYLDPALLLLLEQSPAHGYTLLDRLPEFGLGFLAPTVVYRTLRQMEDRGWVISSWDEKQTQGPPRRVYSITPEGREVLRCCIDQLQNSKQIIEYFLALHDELSTNVMPADAQSLSAESNNKQEKSMRIVIPSEGSHLEAAVSSVFGRSPEFIIVDPESLEFEVVDNPAVSAPGGAGVQAAQTLLQKNINAIIAPNLGPNAFRVLQAAGLKVYYLQSGTVQQNIDAYKAGNLQPIDIPGPDHAGRGHGWRHGRHN